MGGKVLRLPLVAQDFACGLPLTLTPAKRLKLNRLSLYFSGMTGEGIGDCQKCQNCQTSPKLETPKPLKYGRAEIGKL